MRLFTVIDAEQRSEQWFAARLGRATASRAKDILAAVKSGEAAGRRNYRLQLVLERLTGKPQEHAFVSKAMEVGIDREPDAIAEYESLTGQIVHQCGFLSHTVLMAGCSLDGYMGDFDRLLSIKCRQPAAHLEALGGKVPGDALAQIRHELWITGAAEHDYFSWNPDFPDDMRARLITLKAVDLNLREYEAKALAFLAECDTELSGLKKGWRVA